MYNKLQSKLNVKSTESQKCKVHTQHPQANAKHTSLPQRYEKSKYIYTNVTGENVCIVKSNPTLMKVHTIPKMSSPHTTPLGQAHLLASQCVKSKSKSLDIKVTGEYVYNKVSAQHQVPKHTRQSHVHVEFIRPTIPTNHCHSRQPNTPPWAYGSYS